MKYGFSINEKYTKDLGYALQQMRNQLPISYLYEGGYTGNTVWSYCIVK